mmetsp:Transcript_39599/g.51060  ORF Transcript_39599/g.51060 Transcript_39599/m.51060 type:complete len:166 (+) Transcript_39599:2507-3004(+)
MMNKKLHHRRSEKEDSLEEDEVQPSMYEEMRGISLLIQDRLNRKNALTGGSLRHVKKLHKNNTSEETITAVSNRIQKSLTKHHHSILSEAENSDSNMSNYSNSRHEDDDEDGGDDEDSGDDIDADDLSVLRPNLKRSMKQSSIMKPNLKSMRVSKRLSTISSETN